MALHLCSFQEVSIHENKITFHTKADKPNMPQYLRCRQLPTYVSVFFSGYCFRKKDKEKQSVQFVRVIGVTVPKSSHECFVMINITQVSHGLSAQKQN